jgi:hypothetical protein
VSRRVAPPSGMPPPVTVASPTDQELDLRALAVQGCKAYEAEFPDNQERYGPAGFQWCVHDSQHLINWAALSLTGTLSFHDELAWLARILEARDFPLDRLARHLELLAETVLRTHPVERSLCEQLRGGAAFMRSRPSFRS